jgi:hypothetical protein
MEQLLVRPLASTSNNMFEILMPISCLTQQEYTTRAAALQRFSLMFS